VNVFSLVGNVAQNRYGFCQHAIYLPPRFVLGISKEPDNSWERPPIETMLWIPH
jgi:hypothetical protein